MQYIVLYHIYSVYISLSIYIYIYILQEMRVNLDGSTTVLDRVAILTSPFNFLTSHGPPGQATTATTTSRVTIDETGTAKSVPVDILT